MAGDVASALRGLAAVALCAAGLIGLLAAADPANAQVTRPRAAASGASAGKAAAAKAGGAKAASDGMDAKAASDAKSASGNLYAERFASLCAACHGADGRAGIAGAPVLAGQHAFYAITQLFLFREGRRDNNAMNAVARTLNDTDLRGFAEHIGTLPPAAPPEPASAPDPLRMKKGQELARQYKCVFCHGPDLSGGEHVPRIAGQHEDYLLFTLQGFRSGQRVGYTSAMPQALSQVPAEDLETLAYYAARFPVTVPKPAQ